MTQEAIERVRSSLGRSRLRWSPQREQIVLAFLKQDHITIRSLYGFLNRNGRRTPLNTIYRTMRVLCENGFAQARRFGEETQYDNISTKGDHDHLICTGCGHIVEFEDPAIEGLRQQVALANGFHLTGRNLDVPDAALIRYHRPWRERRLPAFHAVTASYRPRCRARAALFSHHTRNAVTYRINGMIPVMHTSQRPVRPNASPLCRGKSQDNRVSPRVNSRQSWTRRTAPLY